ncbi:restriction endonuclease subunit S [Paenibacillus thiaminolyticus]|uniref:restriction endonuclease subunit S n=1 Tax=Paenibacillus thiaminolyticus TaxID=49283 RepID=UPI003D2CD411
MSTGWETVNLCEITHNLDNQRVPLNDSQRNDMKKLKVYPYIGANNILDYIDEYIFDQEILCIAEDGGSWGYQQKCAFIVKEKCWVNNHAHVLTATEKCHLKYLMYFLNYTDLSYVITGTTRGKLTKSALNKIKIPLPPLKEQKKIAAILDKAQALIDKRKEAIIKLDELIQAVFLDMFGDPMQNEKGWNIVKISDVVDDIISGWSVGGKERERNDDELAVLKISSVTSGTFKPDEYKVVSKDVINRKLVHPLKGDILFSRANTRELVGACCIVEDDYFDLFLPDKLWKIKLNESIVNKYFFSSVLSNSSFRTIISNRASGTSGSMMNISKSKLLDLAIILPLLEKQSKYETIKRGIDRQKSIMKKQLIQLETNFNALLQRAFKGELTSSTDFEE